MYSVSLGEKAEGPVHPATAQSYHNLGTLYVMTGRYDEAEKALLTSRKILEKGPEAGRMHLLVVFETLAGLYQEMGRSAESSEYAAVFIRSASPSRCGAAPIEQPPVPADHLTSMLSANS